MTIFIKRSPKSEWAAPTDNDWFHEAKCKGLDGQFHADKSNNPQVQWAKRICNGSIMNEDGTIVDSCPVKRQCLNYAVQNNEKFGVWGGQSERERRRTRRFNGIKSRAPRRTVE